MALKKIKFNNRESLFVVLLICVAILYFHFTLPRYKYNGYTKEFDWDILSYYLYLPLTFIHGDIGIKDYTYIQQLFDHYHFSPTFYQAAQADNGNWVMIYTMGLGMLQFPFFLIGHFWAKIGGYLMDGFSFPYQFTVSTGMYLYILTGVFILRKILLRYFRDRVVAVVLIFLLLGTNYFREAADYNLGPHAILFACYTLLIYYTIKWHETPKYMYAVIIGLTIGIVTLSRPTELISVLIPFFWNVYNKESFFAKIKFLKMHVRHLLILCICVFLVGLPQMLYWKYLTGSFLYNSYWNQQSFNIHESHLMKMLFSFRKGWFVYSPLIVLAFLGFIILLKKEYRNIRIPVYAFIFLNIFLISHVPIWWNAGSFGQRFMVQSYAILALPFAATINFLFEKKMAIKILVFIPLVLLLFLNLFQTWQFANWILPGDGITKEYYFRTFFKTTVTEDDLKLLEYQRSHDPNQKFDDTNPEYHRRTIAYFDMDNVNTDYIDQGLLDTAVCYSGKKSFRMNADVIYSPMLKIPYSEITKKDHAWIRFTVWFYPIHDPKDNPTEIVIHFFHNEKPYQYQGYSLANVPYELNKWNKATVDYLTPSPFSEDDEMRAYVWHRGTKEVYIDDIQVEAFETK